MPVDPQPSFLGCLSLQWRVIRALLMREIVTRYGRDNLGFVWLFLEPMLFTLGVTALWSLTALEHVSRLPIVAFAVTGYSSVLLWRNCATRSSMAIPPNMGLLYHRNVKVLDLFLARILLEVAGATISLVVLSSLWIVLGWMEPPSDCLGVVAAWLLLAWFGAALAIVIGSLTAFSEVTERLWGPISYLLFPLSGAAFMVDWLPHHFQSLVLWIPMVSGTELLRQGFFGTVVATHYELPYLVCFCAVLTLAGLALARQASRTLEVR